MTQGDGAKKQDADTLPIPVRIGHDPLGMVNAGFPEEPRETAGPDEVAFVQLNSLAAIEDKLRHHRSRMAGMVCRVIFGRKM